MPQAEDHGKELVKAMREFRAMLEEMGLTEEEFMQIAYHRLS